MNANTLFNPPKIYRGDKVWYVHYAYRIPGKSEKQRFIVKENINAQPTAELKEKVARAVAERIYSQLKTGWSPFPDDTGRNQVPEFTTMHEEIIAVLDFKKQTISSYLQFKCRINQFKDWLAANDMLFIQPMEIKRHHIFRFLNHIQKTNTLHNRSRNNLLTDIRTLFTTMIDLGSVLNNPTDGLEKLPAKSTRNKAYNKTDMLRILAYIAEADPYLLLFIKFIMMGLRREEITRLHVGDVDLEGKKIFQPSHTTKTNTAKYKVIFERFLPELQAMNLDEYPSHWHLFTAKGIPGATPTTGDFFTVKFKKIKDVLHLDRSYTLYGFRHTTIIALIKNKADLKDTMNISGHDSLAAFQAYLQKYLDEAPKDVSDKLGLEF